MTPANDGELLTMLREGIEGATLRDGDTVPVYLSNKYFKRETMDSAIAALEAFGREKAMAAAFGDTPRKLSGLERLGLCILLDAAGVVMPNKGGLTLPL